MGEQTSGAGRLEDHRFLTGEGRFTADLQRDGEAHGYVLRSPHAHADILSIDAGDAAAMPGVLAVITAQDLSADGLGDLQNKSQIPSDPPMVHPPRPVLARGKVRHVGEAVAFVVAETLTEAQDAAEAIFVDYKDLPAVIDPAAALADGAPEIAAEAPGNLICTFRTGDQSATDAAIGAAAHVLEMTVDNHRISALPLEPRAAIGAYDPAKDELLLTLTGQGVHGIRGSLAGPVFGVANEKLHVMAHDVGGGFGAKNFAYPEWAMVLYAAKKLGRPLKWVAERAEDVLGGAHGRAVKSTARMGLDATGKILGLSAHLTADVGGYLSSGAPGSGTVSVTRSLQGMYDIPAVYMEARAVLTNTAPVDAYRGAGKPEGNFLIERMVETAARRFGFDPVALRRQNAIQSFPYKTALGFEVDTGDFTALVDRAERSSERARFEDRRAEAKARGKLRGLGFASFLESARGAPSEGADVRFTEDGMIEVRPGTESNGQGHETTFTALVAERFGRPMAEIRYIQADTRETRMGSGHGGARSMHMGGTAIVGAIDMALEKGKTVAAGLLQAPAEQVQFVGGDFVAGDGRAVSLSDVAAAARQPEFGLDGGLDSFFSWEDAPITWPAGCHAAEVEIDPETGDIELLAYTGVDDYGVVLNPQLTEGQVVGGLVQGIGQALGEQIVYDPDTAQCLSATLMDYAAPLARTLPMFNIEFLSTPTAANPLGVKGSGQAGAIAASQTVINAVIDALAPLGIDHLDMPATPEKVWRAIRSKQS
jgi:carbon-monoxide dehydrogenase large subunit